MTYRELSRDEVAAAADQVEAWGYWRKVHDYEVLAAFWFTNGQGYLWFQRAPDPVPTLGLHWCSAPGAKPPADWVALVREIAGTLGARRVLIYIPAEAQELHWRALRRYCAVRGWAHSPLGPVLEV